jgi:integral membrane protein (TIGR01906 family)
MNRLITVILSLSLSIFLISSAVKLTLSFRQLYYYDIEYLNIAKDYGMKKEVIIKNYDILIDYLQNKKITKLSMPNFPTSKQGEIHFIEVKDIFMNFNVLFYITGILSLIGIVYKAKIKDFKFLKWGSIGLLAMPVILAIPFGIDFDKSFTAFHKIFFNNDYWEFDPVKDPIINVLPQEFFFHSALLILVLIALFSLVLYFVFRRSKQYKRN